MKKYFALLLGFIIVSCEGPVGPPGPPGPPGPIGQVFEVIADFTPSNNYSQIFAFPEEIVVYQSDIVVVYLLWEVDQETGYDVWQQLPVSVFFSGGELQYAFDHTVADVRLFLTGDINLNTIGPGFTQDQIFRIVILPSEYVQANNVNLKDTEAVMNLVDEETVKRFESKNM